MQLNIARVTKAPVVALSVQTLAKLKIVINCAIKNAFACTTFLKCLQYGPKVPGPTFYALSQPNINLNFN